MIRQAGLDRPDASQEALAELAKSQPEGQPWAST